MTEGERVRWRGRGCNRGSAGVMAGRGVVGCARLCEWGLAPKLHPTAQRHIQQLRARSDVVELVGDGG